HRRPVAASRQGDLAHSPGLAPKRHRLRRGRQEFRRGERSGRPLRGPGQGPRRAGRRRRRLEEKARHSPSSSGSVSSPVPFVTLSGHRIEYQDIPAARPGAPDLIVLHEGLGSLALWRDFPANLAAATGCRTVTYSRWGYGKSDPFPGPRDPLYMHSEALEDLPALREALGLGNPILVGHSDGASIAL